MTAFQIHVEILQLINSLHKNTWPFKTNKKLLSVVSKDFEKKKCLMFFFFQKQIYTKVQSTTITEIKNIYKKPYEQIIKKKHTNK